MAFDGTLLNRPSGPERSISTALQFEYTGVFVQPAVATVSPDGDGVADRQSLRYKVVRPSTVTVRLVGAGRLRRATSPPRRGSRAATGSPSRRPPGLRTGAGTALRAHAGLEDGAAAAPTPVQGRWKLTVVGHRRHRAAVRDDAVLPRQHDRRLPLDEPARSSSSRRRAATCASRGSRRRPPASSSPSRPRRARCSARSRSAPTPRVRSGVTWNGLDRTRKPVKGGRYVVRVVAKNALGTLDLARTLRVQRIAGSGTLSTVSRCRSPRSRAR